MKPVDVLTSADIFCLTTMVDDDMNIGQRIEDVADYVDFVYPMIYPSHYPRQEEQGVIQQAGQETIRSN